VLAEIAADIGLGDALRLGRGEDAGGGRAKPSILADAFEAVIAAVYLDGGWEVARAVVLGLVEERIVAGAAGPGGRDAKSQLQEYTARRYDQVPRYRLQREGPDHEPRFFATVTVRNDVLGRGEGSSKRQAEQAAANEAWRRLHDEPEGLDAGAA
jgi:ribonuclease III